MTSQPGNSYVLSPIERKLMQHVASRTEQGGSKRGSTWVRYGVPYPAPAFEAAWPWDTYRPLVEGGLLERQEDWKDVYVKLTDAGWEALSR